MPVFLLALIVAVVPRPAAPEAPTLTFATSHREVDRSCRQALTATRQQFDGWLIRHEGAAKTEPNEAVALIDELLGVLHTRTIPLEFLQDVSSDDAIRAAALACTSQRDTLERSLFTHPEMVERFRLLAKKPGLLPVEEKLLRRFHGYGGWLTLRDQRKLERLYGKLATVEEKYKRAHLAESKSIGFKANLLEGVAAAFLTSLSRTPSGGYRVPLTSYAHEQILGYAKSEKARKRFYRAWTQPKVRRQKRWMKRALRIRTKLARVLAASSWADLRIRQAGALGRTPQDIRAFVLNILQDMRPAIDRDLIALEEDKAHWPDSEVLDRAAHPWDVAYARNRSIARNHAFDDRELRRYFPLRTVLTRAFGELDLLFGLAFVRVPAMAHATWADDVLVYEVRDRLADQTLLGYLYLDLHERAGKPARANFTAGLRRYRTRATQLPAVAVVSSLAESADDGQPLLTPRDIEGLMHEFGHAVHHLVLRTPHHVLNGASSDSMAEDGLELPAQLLANYVWEPGVLERLSGHITTATALPHGMADRVRSARRIMNGPPYAELALRAIYDLDVHMGTIRPAEILRRYRARYKTYVGMTTIKRDRSPAAFFELMTGKDVSGYARLWAEVQALDVLVALTGETRMDTSGHAFRTTWLTHNDGAKQVERLRTLLGRDALPTAFLRKVFGLGQPAVPRNIPRPPTM